MGLLDIIRFMRKKKPSQVASQRGEADLDGLLQEAIAEYNSSSYDKAELILREIIKVHPNSAEAHYYLGLVLEQVSREEDFETLEEAMGEFRKVISLVPNHVDSRIRLGALNLKGGFFEGAIRELEEAISIDPSSAEAHAALGEAFYRISLAKEVRVEHPTGLGATTDFRGAKEYLEKALGEFNTALELDEGLAGRISPMVERIKAKLR
ncbi:MAG: tetratricopeptide repeat protein [Candidatus Caldarchaeum sp.]